MSPNHSSIDVHKLVVEVMRSWLRSLADAIPQQGPGQVRLPRHGDAHGDGRGLDYRALTELVYRRPILANQLMEQSTPRAIFALKEAGDDRNSRVARAVNTLSTVAF
jgi:hypothetical protein